MTDQNKPSKFKSALNFGALLGLILMIQTLVTYIFELYDQQWFGFIGYIILIGGIILGTKKFRDESNGGFISYGSALGYGILLALFASVIVSFGNYIYLSFVDSGLIDFTLEQAEKGMYDAGSPDDQIEMAMEYTRKFTTPGMIAIMGVVATTFFGFIISLISSAFLKKEAEYFDDAQ